KAVPGRDGCREDAQLLSVARSGDEFFAPVAEDVRAKAGIGFGAVVGDALEVGAGKEARLLIILVVPLGDGHAVEQLAEQVAVPPDSHVARSGRRRGNPFATHVVKAADSQALAPHLEPAIARVDVHRAGASNAASAGRGQPEQLLARAGVAQLNARGVRT